MQEIKEKLCKATLWTAENTFDTGTAEITENLNDSNNLHDKSLEVWTKKNCFVLFRPLLFFFSIHKEGNNRVYL